MNTQDAKMILGFIGFFILGGLVVSLYAAAVEDTTPEPRSWTTGYNDCIRDLNYALTSNATVPGVACQHLDSYGYMDIKTCSQKVQALRGYQ